MKHIICILKMEVLHIFRDMQTFLVAVISPLLMMVVLGFIISIDIRHIDIAVVVPHPTSETSRYLESLKHNPLFRFKGEYLTMDEPQKMIRRGEVDAYIMLHSDFRQAPSADRQGRIDHPMVQIVSDGTNPFVSKASTGYIQAALENQTDAASFVSVSMLYNPQLKSVFYFGPGIIGFALSLICLLLSSSSIVSEKVQRTACPIILSHIRPWELFVGKMTPYLFVGLLTFALSVLEGHFILGIPINGSYLSILFLNTLFIITSLLTGMVIAFFSNSRMEAIILCVGFITIPVFYFCGMVTPVENLPNRAQMIGYALYPTHYISAMRKLMIEGVALSDVLWQVGLIVLSAYLLLVVCLFKLRKDRWLR